MNITFSRLITLVLLLVFLGSKISASLAAEDGRHRLLVLTDFKADPDDEQSLIRLLLYANEIDIEAIVATTSTHKRANPAPQAIRDIIGAYGQVQQNLLLHDPAYPSEAELLALVKVGSPVYGMSGVGQGQDSAGSESIIRALEQADERPLWVSVWGGVNTLAQALYSIRETRSTAEAAALIGKLRVYAISDQDDSGAWIRREFPDLFYIVSPGGYGRSTWTAFTRGFDGFGDYISNQWLADNIQQGHGPLGAMYPDVAWGVEGDTPAYLALIPNGLSVPDHPDWGGWGGRYELYQPSDEEIGVGTDGPGNVAIEPETRPIWTNAVDRFSPWVRTGFGRSIGPVEQVYESNHVTLLRWRDDIQRDFAARMDWTVKARDEANHPPVVGLTHAAELSAKSGQGFVLDAGKSHDPDGDSLSYHWFNYAEAGTLDEPVDMGWAVNQPGVYFTLPTVTSTQTAHFILALTDKGTPALTRYARVIVTITPEG
jgi:hypothetical protein